MDHEASDSHVEDAVENRAQEAAASKEVVSSPEAPEAEQGSPKGGKQAAEPLEDEECDLDDEQPEQILARQDAYCLFTNEKDLKSPESITLKAQHSNGISVRVKIVNDKMLGGVLSAITGAKDQGITKLRFEDCRLLTKAVAALRSFCRTTSPIESLGLIRVSFSDGGSQDFKHLVEAISYNAKISHF